MKINKILILVVLGFVLSASSCFATWTIDNGISNNSNNGTTAYEPVASPVAGTYTSNQSVTLTATNSSSIHYRTDGTAPTCSTDTTYVSAISVTSSQTIKAIACYNEADGSTSPSLTSSFAYVLQCPTVSNAATYNAYPTCGPATCNSGYDLSGSTCTEHRSSSGGSSGGHVAPATDTTTVTPSTTTTTTTTNFQFVLSLKLGSRGNEVLQLQKILIAKGYLFGTADGSFGPKTHLAVIAFQKANNLFADGVVGRGTRAVLNNSNMIWLQPVVATTTTTTTTEANTVVTTTTTYNFGTTTLTLWSRGEAVKELQRFLNKALSLNLTIDGVLGPKTINIIKQWQKANGLLDDGLVGAKTKALMNAIAKSFK